jgi:hypothetical protein
MEVRTLDSVAWQGQYLAGEANSSITREGTS